MIPSSTPLEYIVINEMVHRLEATHSRFVALMDQFIANWRFYREQLNQLPVRRCERIKKVGAGGSGPEIRSGSAVEQIEEMKVFAEG